MVSSLEKGFKISHPAFYHTNYMKVSSALACLGTKSKKQQILKKKSQFLRKWDGRIVEFCFLCQDKHRSDRPVIQNTL